MDPFPTTILLATDSSEEAGLAAQMAASIAGRTGSDEQNEIYGLEGDDTINPGNDSVRDYVYCGPGFDTVNQMPRAVPDDVQDAQGASQYASDPDVIAEDCEERAL